MTATVRDTFDMACPACGVDEELAIYMHTWAPLTADGTDANDGEHVWDENDECVCRACGHNGKVGDFISIRI